MTAPQVRGIDIMGIFNAAQQANSNRQRMQLQDMQIKQQQGQQRLQAQTQRALGTGDIEQIRRVNPRMAQEIEKGRLDVRKTEADIDRIEAQTEGTELDLERKQKLQQARSGLAAVDAIKRNPASARFQAARLQSEGVDLAGLGVDLGTPEGIQALESQSQQVFNVFGDPAKFSGAAQKAAELMNYTTPDQARRADPEAFQVNLERIMFTEPRARAAAGAPVINVGGEEISPLEKTNRGKLQTSVLESQGLINSLQRVKSLAKPEFFTVAGRIKNKGASLLAAVDPEFVSAASTDSLKTRKRLNNEVEQLFNQYRKEITGAAASEKELTTLRNVMLNTSLNWPEFQAAFEQFHEKVSADLRLKQKALRDNGVDITDPRSVENKMLELKAGGAANTQDADVEARIAELESDPNNRPADVVDVLLTEGYITEEIARTMLDGAGN